MADRPLRRIPLLTAVVFCLAFAPGCTAMRAVKTKLASWKPFTSAYDDPMADEKFAKAQAFFDNGNYSKACPIYKELADNTGNSATLAEQSRWMQAESRRLQWQYPEAVDVYHRLLMDFPTGVHRREATFKIFQICDYWLDDFRDELIVRQNESGVLHWHPGWPNFFDRSKPKLLQESEALNALEYVHTFGEYDGPLADKSLFWCGYVNFIRGNFDEANNFFSQLVENHKDSSLRPQAIVFAIQAKNAATGGAIYDGRLCAEALYLINMAEASVPELANDPAMVEKLAKSKFAIRYQQAEKDFRTAAYYERTGHPGSAIFYYELTRRRYPGTRYAELATAHKARLKEQMDAGKIPLGNDPLILAQAKWKQLFGKKTPEPEDDDDGADAAPRGLDPRLAGGSMGGSFGGMGMGGMGMGGMMNQQGSGGYSTR